MKRAKVSIAIVSLICITAALVGQALAYPPFLIKARKFGAKDCTFCHIDPLGGPPWNERGQWLVEERERRKADVIDVEWLADYKPGQTKTGKAANGDATPTHDNSTQQELTNLLNELVEAAKKQDTAAFDRILADDFIETNADSLMFDKAQVLAAIPQVAQSSYEFSEVKARFFGDTAVMTFRQNSKGKFQGQDFSGDYRETLVWVKRDGRWQIVAAHVSRIAK